MPVTDEMVEAAVIAHTRAMYGDLAAEAARAKPVLWVYPPMRRALEAALRWIPCVERMPVEGDRVAVIVQIDGYPEVSVATYDGTGGWTERRYGGIYPEHVTHWMPLPEPPQT